MRKRCIKLLLAILCLSCFCNIYPQTKDTTIAIHKNSIFTTIKKPVMAAVETIGLNAGIWAFNRYVLNTEYSRISAKTVKHNLQHSLVWDNDYFATNFFLHPYQGGLYFNAARSNGMNFGKSALYSIGGSLMWEYLMEDEPPSINDIISTPVSGVLMGEIQFRMANLIIDSRTAGWKRFGREFLAFVINPVYGFNRLIYGKTWKTGSYSGQMTASRQTVFFLTSGYRGLASSTGWIDNSAYIDFGILYGNFFSDENEKPYDAFTMTTTLNMLTEQPVFSNVNITGEILSSDILLKNNRIDMRWGVFQHFDYYDSETPASMPDIHTYRFCEAAAFGLGGMLRIKPADKTVFTSNLYINGIILGSVFTDYFRLFNRDYNYGSGFGIKLNNELNINDKTTLDVDIEHYRLFSWKGYDTGINLAGLKREEQLDFDVHGDESYSGFTAVKLKFKHRLKKHLLLAVSSSGYMRYSRYMHFPDIKSTVFDCKIGLGYIF